MIKFPEAFVQLDRYPGYYWHTEEKQLYSIKISGVLHKMVKRKAFRGFGYDVPAGWRVSKNGSQRVLSEDHIILMIAKWNLVGDQVVPVEKGVNTSSSKAFDEAL